ncbi:response regulator [Leptothermofonsia sichuanensis E412]|uniref:response regulator n=1 Tax=Leptothermofonsia sichuanensis TaxID=2917832 RepID=UPI001CA6AF88|nr:response regulator [Leptothermofonsia sichuanensis]QZZ18882.1 response regulator [Leptothermofonsia sichuanensis E412]
MLNRFKIGIRIGSGFALGLAILTMIGIVSYQTTTSLIANSRRENRTYQTLGQLSQLEAELVNAETGQRGYIITGQPRYLDPYDSALKVIDRNYEELRRLTQDNPDHQRRLDKLKPLIEARLARLREGIRLLESEGFAAAQKFTLSDEGRRLMQQIRALTGEMELEEQEVLRQRTEQAQLAAQQTLNTLVYGIPASFVVLSLVGLWLSRNISRPLQQLSATAEKIANGDLSVRLPESNARDETGVLTRSFSQMVLNLRETIQTNEDQRWLKSNLADLSQSLQGQRNLEMVAEDVLTRLAPLVGAQQGLFYILDPAGDPPILKLLSSYAYRERKHLANQFRLGEGLVGQCALEKRTILLTDVPADYLRITSGLGEAAPVNIVVVPLLFEMQIRGVVELAALHPFSNLQLIFLEEASGLIGVMVNAIAAHNQTQELLKQSQILTEELRHQQEELLQSNQLLEERTQSLQASEMLLQQQQEELQQSNEELQQLNEELEEKAELLESQKQQVEYKNAAIEQARQELEQQAEQLALSSKYKSEFLANMSHELRTPLNSLLILAQLLSENSEGNLSERQVEYSRTIHAAGTDLLLLINDILDLAKIESGTMSVDVESVSFTALQSDLERTFQPMAHSRGLEFGIALDEDLPPSLFTDPKRLQQILRNLLSNALKFTEQGSVTVQISRTTIEQIAFAVSDTGIGIPPDKQQIIFEAFQQVDGTTSRRYGGTGLGLSISLQLSRLLGGRIELVSQPEQGSTFTLYLPERYSGAHSAGGEVASGESHPPHSIQAAGGGFPAPEERSPVPLRSLPPLPTDIEDDRANLQPDDQVLLVIEDDISFARILLDMAHRQGFKVLIALQGHAGITLAQQCLPQAITLDLHLPDMEGFTVLEQLKDNPATRHIPIHILTVDDQQQREFQMGAIAHIQKPVSPEVITQTLIEIKHFIERQVKHLLVIEDDQVQAQSMIDLIGGEDVESTAVATGTAALEILKSQSFDCVVLDLGLPDMSGFDLIEQIKQESNLVALPIIVYTGKELTGAEETRLRRLAETIIIKDVRSPERLLEETALFLHRVQATLPPARRQMLEQLRQTDPALAGKKVLIVDDDVRNIFALTSLLEQYQIDVLFAENGSAGIEKLQTHPDINLVLMDVMMPGMDGYETTRAIRQQEQFRSLPIIALTAKAMQGDREKCIEAGASDYIPKPVDTEQLLSLLRLWLYR